MVVCTAHLNLRIEDIVVNNTETERTPNGKITVQGTCKVILDDHNESFTMNFSYIGKPNEPSSKMLDSLKELGWKKYQESIDEPDTLMNFVLHNNNYTK